MKKKNEQWLRYSNRALSGLLMLFGFVSCDNGGGDIPVEYGMPSAKYRVKGKVHLKNIVLSFAMWMVMPMVLILRIVSR